MAKQKFERSINAAAEEKQLRARLAEIEAAKVPDGLLECLHDGWLPQGVRLAIAGHDEGRTIVFTDEEAKTLVEPLKAIVEKRKAVAQAAQE